MALRHLIGPDARTVSVGGYHQDFGAYNGAFEDGANGCCPCWRLNRVVIQGCGLTPGDPVPSAVTISTAGSGSPRAGWIAGTYSYSSSHSDPSSGWYVWTKTGELCQWDDEHGHHSVQHTGSFILQVDGNGDCSARIYWGDPGPPEYLDMFPVTVWPGSFCLAVRNGVASGRVILQGGGPGSGWENCWQYKPDTSGYTFTVDFGGDWAEVCDHCTAGDHIYVTNAEVGAAAAPKTWLIDGHCYYGPTVIPYSCYPRAYVEDVLGATPFEATITESYDGVLNPQCCLDAGGES